MKELTEDKASFLVKFRLVQLAYHWCSIFHTFSVFWTF